MKVLFVSLIIVIIDQLTKLFVKGFSIPILNFEFKGMDYGSSINVIGDLFKFTFVENPGMAFGIDVDGYAKLFLSLFSLIASVAIILYLYKVRHQKFLFRFALALILGGAIGNLIDRFFYGIIFDYAPLFYGRVVDFLHVDTFGFTIFGRKYDSFPIFNIADSAVTVGVFILLIFHKKFEKGTTKVSISTEPDNKNKLDDLNFTSTIIGNDNSYTKENNN